MKSGDWSMAVLLALPLALPAGCMPQRIQPLPPPPTEVTRSQFGRVVVTWQSQNPLEIVDRPPIGACDTLGRGAVTGMITDGLITVIVASPGASAQVLGVIWIGASLGAGIAVLPVAALAGSLYGLAATPSAEDIEEASRVFRETWTDARLPQRIARKILDDARSRGGTNMQWSEPGAARPSCESICQVGNVEVVLEGYYGVVPNLRLTVSATVLMIRADSGEVLHRLKLHRSRPAKADFMEWTRSGAQLLKTELEGAPAELGERFVDEIFLLHLLPHNRAWKEKP